MLEEAQKLAGRLREIRRQIHKHPELGFEEKQTAKLVAQELRDLGYAVTENVARTGVIGETGGGSTVAIRADMDALPIQEETGEPYASTVPGVMHACGHDAHIACALGAAMLLARRKPSQGRVMFIFQPCEETTDDEGVGGAERMIAERVHEGVDAFLALHVDGETDPGTVLISPGPVMAAVDAFFVDVLGKGCHGAYPHKGTDPIFLSNQLMNTLYGLSYRKVNPGCPAVVSLGSIHGGSRENIVPDKVSLSGTLRSFDEETGASLREQLERACRAVEQMGGTCELRFERGYPPTQNDPELTSIVRDTAVRLLGADRVKPVKIEMGSEDFSLFAEKAPATFFFLGARKSKGAVVDHHNSRFDIDDSVLPIGAAVLAASATKWLEST
jgi:amidohydrolase